MQLLNLKFKVRIINIQIIPNRITIDSIFFIDNIDIRCYDLKVKYRYSILSGVI